MRTVLVSANDDNFLPLAKGLWLSLRDLPLGDQVQLGWVDIGQSERTKRWLHLNVPGLIVRRPTSEVDTTVTGLAPMNYHRAALLRPYLADMFPEADVIIWIDADA